MNLKIKPYEDLTEEEKIDVLDFGKRKELTQKTEVQYYRGELYRIRREMELFIFHLTFVDETINGEEIDEPDFMWTDEQYQEIVERYRKRVEYLNRLFDK